MMRIFALLFIAVVRSEVPRNPGVAPWVSLNNGLKIPQLAFGTWLGVNKEGGRVDVENNDVEKAVEWAIDAGYRHIDTAHIYKTEGQVGRAIQKKIEQGVVPRDDLFITTKLWNDHHSEDEVVPALKESLAQLNLSYVDLYLIHWPVALSSNGSVVDIDYLETWRGMIEALNLGLTKSIGVSNFNLNQMNRLISFSSVNPAVLQIEVNLNLQQPSLLKYCREQNITVMGYTPFGSLFHAKAQPGAPAPRTDEPALVKMADAHNKTVPQIALRYLLDLGVVPIPKSVTKSRLEQNLQVFDFALTSEETALLRGYDKGYRTIAALFWAESPYYPFEK